ncbi:MAG: XRE family transcriptional regulator [candidate division NC10 bacterium]|nr:XRE family transcriptional regulator [candidate division NC10 bacterium]MBI4390439.1 XRE family transcriptional regulator [candidate division NC10 bacterium]
MKTAKRTRRPATQRAVMRWAADRLARDPGFARDVEARLAELRIEQELAALRKARGLSQHQLAQRLRVSQPAIAKIEAGRVKNLELRTVVRFAAALGARVRFAIEKGRRRARAVVPA